MYDLQSVQTRGVIINTINGVNPRYGDPTNFEGAYMIDNATINTCSNALLLITDGR